MRVSTFHLRLPSYCTICVSAFLCFRVYNLDRKHVYDILCGNDSKSTDVTSTLQLGDMYYRCHMPCNYYTRTSYWLFVCSEESRITCIVQHDECPTKQTPAALYIQEPNIYVMCRSSTKPGEEYCASPSRPICKEKEMASSFYRICDVSDHSLG